MTEEFFTLGVQAGGGAAGETTEPYFVQLRKSLALNSRASYSETLKEFAFVLRVDGPIWHWHKTGCDFLRVSPKHGYATVDIFMPEEIWKGGDGMRISSYLEENTRTGFQMMLDRVRNKKIDINAEKLTQDFETAMKAFRRSAKLADVPVEIHKTAQKQ